MLGVREVEESACRTSVAADVTENGTSSVELAVPTSGPIATGTSVLAMTVQSVCTCFGMTLTLSV